MTEYRHAKVINESTCRHCNKPIYTTGRWWQHNENGLLVCVEMLPGGGLKAVLETQAEPID